MIFRDASVIKERARVFEEDWAASERAESADVRKMASLPIEKTAKKMAKNGQQEPAGGTGGEGSGHVHVHERLKPEEWHSLLYSGQFGQAYDP
jgi:hypothetical protein